MTLVYLILNLILLVSIPFEVLSEEVKDYVIVHFDSYAAKNEEKEIKLETSDKTSSMVLNHQGLLIDGILKCAWGPEYGGPLGMIDVHGEFIKNDKDPCDEALPFMYAGLIGFMKTSIDAIPYTAIRITAIEKNDKIEVPYQGKKFSGSIGEWFHTVIPKEGSAIDHQVKKERIELLAERKQFYETTGIAQVRKGLTSCLQPTLKSPDCFKEFLPPSGIFKYNLLEVNDEIASKELHKRLSEDKDLFKDFKNCVSTENPTYKKENETTLDIIPDDEYEMYWGCHFKMIDSKWYFEGMSWFGC